MGGCEQLFSASVASPLSKTAWLFCRTITPLTLFIVLSPYVSSALGATPPVTTLHTWNYCTHVHTCTATAQPQAGRRPLTYLYFTLCLRGHHPLQHYTRLRECRSVGEPCCALPWRHCLTRCPTSCCTSVMRGLTPLRRHLCQSGVRSSAAEALLLISVCRSPGSGLLGRRTLYCVMRPPSKSAHAVPRGTELVPIVWTNA